MTLDRAAIIDSLASALRSVHFTQAAWLGGSDATGRTDEWSDIDIAVVVNDSAVEDTFLLVEAALEQRSAIARRVRIPQPTWHGHDQAFYQLADARPTLMIDLSVIKLSHPDRFLEPERHGTPIVLFDRSGIVVPAELDRAALAGRMRARVDDLRSRFPLFQNLVVKAVNRDSLVEAVAMFHGMTLRPLVDVLRVLHVPERFDFGLRYLQDDLPIDTYRILERMVLPADGPSILAQRERAEELFTATLAAIDERDVIAAFERDTTLQPFNKRQDR